MKAHDRLRLIRVKIERAEKHLGEVEEAVLSLGEATFKTVSLQYDPDTAKPSFEFRPLYIYGYDIPAIAGDVIHNLRSALDHLAFQLVIVGISFGESRTEKWENIHFPIFHSLKSYEAGKIRRTQGMRREAVEAIDRLKPYKDGNAALWLLHKLDNADKHSFILVVGEDAIIGGVSLKTYSPNFVSFGTPVYKQHVNLARKEARIEPEVGEPNALLSTLHTLTLLVSDIVTTFLPLLQDNIPAPQNTGGGSVQDFMELFGYDDLS